MLYLNFNSIYDETAIAYEKHVKKKKQVIMLPRFFLNIFLKELS